jgi:aldehyde:ferredoxin oxidoreductase
VVTDYYAAHGWDEDTGRPKTETLEKLGIAEYATA